MSMSRQRATWDDTILKCFTGICEGIEWNVVMNLPFSRQCSNAG